MAIVKVLGFLLFVFLRSITAHAINELRDLQPCGEPLFIDNGILIDVQTYKNCKLQILTEPNRILAFNLIKGDLEDALEFFTIHDGPGNDSPMLLFENQEVHKVSKKDLPKTLYTTKSVAEIAFKKMPTSSLKLKIQRAVNCPADLGLDTECGRVLNEVSCYCATFNKNDQPSQSTFCRNNSMLLISLESRAEEQAVQLAWGLTTVFWTSGSDKANEGLWMWESTNKRVYPGYANWNVDEPDCITSPEEDCIEIGHSARGGWNDAPCSYYYFGLCEAQP